MINFCIHAQNHAKIHPKFRAKKYFFRINAQFRANLLQKHETVAQENLLFRGNPNTGYTTQILFNFIVVNNSIGLGVER